MPRENKGVNISDFIKPSDFIGQRCSYFHKGLRNHFEKYDKEKLAEFEACQTDKERVDMIWKNEVLHDMIELEPEWEMKDAGKSAELRTKGNKYFQTKSYVSATEEYTNSILYAPRETDEGKKNELALSFANRSASLFHMKKYKMALLDITQALEHNYPADMKVKLYERRGKCYSELGQKEKAVESYRQGLDSLTNAALDDKGMERWTKSMQSQLDGCEKIEKKATEEEEEPPVIPKVESPQEMYPNISKSVSVEHLTEIGRYLKSQEQVDVGKPIIVERPLCSVIFSDYHKTHCYHCFKRITMAAVPCPQCATVRYCTRECAEPNWTKYHQYECKHFETYDTGYCAKIGHLALRLIMQIGVKKIIDIHRSLRESPAEPEENGVTDQARLGCNSDGLYVGDYETFLKLSAGPEADFPRVVTACSLLKLLAASGILQQDGEDLATTENLCELAGAILLHLRILQCNAIIIKEMSKPSDLENPKPYPMGAGVYPSIALVNHSCDPNADLNFYGDTVVLRALRNIYSGLQICRSYGVVYYDDGWNKRQDQLKEDYFYRCECPPCIGKWPIAQLTEDEVPHFRCEECHTAFTSYKLEEKKFNRCENCEHTQNLESNMGELFESHERFRHGLAEAMNGSYATGLKDLQTHLTLLQLYICPPWKDFTSTQVAVQNCYRLMGNRCDK